MWQNTSSPMTTVTNTTKNYFNYILIAHRVTNIRSTELNTRDVELPLNSCENVSGQVH